MLGEHLDRHEAAQLFVVRQVDDRHAPVPEGPLDPVAPFCERLVQSFSSFCFFFFSATLVLAALVRLRRRNASDSRDQIVRRRSKVFLEGGGHASRVDRGERFLLQLLREARGSTGIAGGESLCDLVTSRRKRGRNGGRKLRRRGGPRSRAAPAAGETDRGRQGRDQVRTSRSGLPPLQASANPA